MSIYQSRALKSWAVEERPREKVMANGIQYLSDAELLAILVGSGTRNMTAVELARNILGRVENNLHELGRQSVGDLVKIKGVGPAKAISSTGSHGVGPQKGRNASDRESTGEIQRNCIQAVSSPAG